MKNKRIVSVLSICLVAVIIASVILAVIFANRETDTYSFVMNAIEKTERQEQFMVQINSLGQIKSGGVTQQTDTDGFITSVDNKDIVHFYLNTRSTTTGAEAEDFDVTVSMFCADDTVYDNSTGSNRVVEDMTAEEFREIVDGYGLYKYSKDKVLNASFVENEMEGYENCGEMTVILSAPEDEVLDAYAGKLSEVTGEEIGRGDLKVNSATVAYEIYDGRVQAQTYSFSVTYEKESGQEIMYTAVSEVCYTDVLTDDYDEFIPIEQETATEEE